MTEMFDSKFFGGKTALVTGASGFIGAHLCRRLEALGVTVHGVSRTPRQGGFVSKWWKVELDDSTETRKLVDAVAPDIIFHLASFVSGKRDLNYVLPALRSNFLSAVNLLAGVTETDCARIVLTGSLEEPEGDIESAVPASPYAAAKGAASTYARMFHALYGTPVVTARLFMVYGPGQNDHTKLVPYVTRSLLKNQVAELMSGTREVDWVYVDDVVDAYLVLGSREGVEGETVDVGSGKLVSVRSVVEQITEIIGPGVTPVFGGVADRPMERVRVADTARAFEVSGWQPKTLLRDGLRSMVDWYRVHG
jgi:UDP-glucose 4-epimerase